jgi:hypothetical protein
LQVQMKLDTHIHCQQTLIGVGNNLGRSSSLITGRIPLSALLAAPNRDLVARLVLQA